MDVDVSSYRSDPQPSSLDIAGKLGGLQAQAQGIQRQGIGIESDKLKLANERLGVLAKEYTTLLADNDVMTGNPNAATKVQAMGQRMVNLGVIPANMFGEFAKSIPTDAKAIPQFIQQQMARVQSIGEAITYHQGSLGPTLDTGNAQQPTRFSPKTGLTPEGNSIPTQIPPTAQTIDPNTNQQRMQGPTTNTNPVITPPNRLPVGPPQMPPANVNAGPNVGPAAQNAAPATNSRVPAPSGPATGQPVSFETNRLAHAAAYKEAVERIQATRPLIQAFKLIDEFSPRTGPGTQTYNNAIAFLQANNLIPPGDKTNSTVVYQMLNKYLAQSVSQMGSKSDADQAQKLLGSPDVTKQVLPALKELTYKNIETQRGLAILPYMYTSKDYGTKNFHEETGKNVNMVNGKALMLDHIKDDDERDKLLDEMRKKRNTREGKTFEATLEAMKRGGMNLGGQ